MVDGDCSTVFLHPQMIPRRRSRFRSHHARDQSVGCYLSSLRRDDLFPQPGRIIIDRHRSWHDRGRSGRWFGRRIARRCFSAADERVGHIDGHFPVRPCVMGRPVASAFAAVTGAATADTPPARSTAAACIRIEKIPIEFQIIARPFNAIENMNRRKYNNLPAPVLLRIDGLPFMAPMVNVVDVV